VPAAISEWEQAIKLKPDLADPLAGAGIAYFSLGQKEKGMANLKHALALDPLYSYPDYLRYEAFWSERQISIEQTMVKALSHKN
jgi:tetratricopeptide (TPR) repeat protein